MSDVPVLNDLVIREFVRSLLRRTHPPTQDIILLHGRYEPGAPTELKVEDRKVRVADCPSVLSVLEAEVGHVGGLLVIVTPYSDDELGNTLRSRAVKQRALRIHRWEIVLQRFGARERDPRLRDLDWVAEGLLSMGRRDGLKVAGTMLDYDTALRCLVQHRLGLTSDAPDITDLLTWTLERSNVSRLEELRGDERAGLEDWLVRTAGTAANPLFALISNGHGTDALPFALLADMLWNPELEQTDPKDSDPAAVQSRAMAFGRAQGRAEAYLGSSADPGELLTLAKAARGVVALWIGRAADADPAAAATGQLLDSVLLRADQLLSLFGAEALARYSSVLQSGLRARIDVLAALLPERPGERGPRSVKGHQQALSAIEQALRIVEDHELAMLRAEEVNPARMAVRLVRWLAAPDEPPVTVADGIKAHVRTLGFVDRALATLWLGDPTAPIETAETYARIHDRARAVRDQIDEAFAGRLAAWAQAAVPSEGLLLVENTMERIVLPLARGTDPAPLVLVLDGMSSAVACRLAEQIRQAGWVEAARDGLGREAALAAIPSVTTVSRTSLLCAALSTGGQDVEQVGFTAFWRRHRIDAALFHKGDLAGGAAQRLSRHVNEAISRAEGDERQVVAVVLNTIDDALDRGPAKADWALDEVSYLPELLTAARLRGRPVVVVSDHGHVLERERGLPSGEAATSARWRSASIPPKDGEIELRGPRVLLSGGSVVVPWRETIRYTPRKAGYHGGAALAEMAIPVLAFLPSADASLPRGWHLLPPERTVPAWWDHSTPSQAAAPATPAEVRQRKKAASDEDALFAVSELPYIPTLGEKVVDTETYREQRRYVRKPPKDNLVASVVDSLIDAGGTLSVEAVAEITATQPVRVPGLLATLRTLLNVESYPILAVIDGGRTVTLDAKLLKTQFGLRDEA
ncbi:BREX-2 system phosphatase PglZ [Microbispora rosea]|uniref:BREX-2 system phosphatase PglZ n=1 Tax=Microbispora rosea TaxID=58117 RepID=UPI00068AD844|nr:BREX-2 system phosphatase PglZ [Microbispora rosea]